MSPSTGCADRRWPCGFSYIARQVRLAWVGWEPGTSPDLLRATALRHTSPMGSTNRRAGSGSRPFRCAEGPGFRFQGSDFRTRGPNADSARRLAGRGGCAGLRWPPTVGEPAVMKLSKTKSGAAGTLCGRPLHVGRRALPRSCRGRLGCVLRGRHEGRGALSVTDRSGRAGLFLVLPADASWTRGAGGPKGPVRSYY